jgi:hypothetical protein
MSLINEALKRTQDAQQQSAPAAAGPALRPADPVQTKTARSARTLLFIMVAAVVLGNLLLWMAFNERSENDATPKPETPVTAAATSVIKPAAEPVPVPPLIAPAPTPATTVPQPVPAPEVVAKPATATATTNTPAPESQVVFAEPPKPTVLRLQSIMYGSRPSAMIAGKFLFVGDSIQEHQVVAIDKATVTLVGQGQTNVLSLP